MQSARMIWIIFCMKLLFKMRWDDIKKIGLKTTKGSFRKGWEGGRVGVSVSKLSLSLFTFDFFAIWNNVSYSYCKVIPLCRNQNMRRQLFILRRGDNLKVLVISIYRTILQLSYNMVSYFYFKLIGPVLDNDPQMIRIF